MYGGTLVLHGLLNRKNVRELLVLYLHLLQRPLSDLCCLRRERTDRLSAVDDPLRRQDRLVSDRKSVDDGGKVSRRNHGPDPGEAFSSAHIEFQNPRVGVGAAKDLAVKEVRKSYVCSEGSRARYLERGIVPHLSGPDHPESLLLSFFEFRLGNAAAQRCLGSESK